MVGEKESVRCDVATSSLIYRLRGFTVWRKVVGIKKDFEIDVFMAFLSFLIYILALLSSMIAEFFFKKIEFWTKLRWEMLNRFGNYSH